MYPRIACGGLPRTLVSLASPRHEQTRPGEEHAPLQGTGLPVETGSGGRTKYNRSVRSLPKTHWSDAACVGASTPEPLIVEQVVPLLITATGRGRRKMCNTNELDFPVSHRKRRKGYFGYQTGDLVRAVVPSRLKCPEPMWGESRSKRRGLLPSLPATAGSPMSPIAIVGLCIAAMAIAMSKG
jgi:hypothetical protein